RKLRSIKGRLICTPNWTTELLGTAQPPNSVAGFWNLRSESLGHFAQPQPIAFDGLADFNEVIEVDGLDEEGIGAQLIRAIDIGNFFGRSEDNYAEGFQSGVLANPAQDFEAVQFGHL